MGWDHEDEQSIFFIGHVRNAFSQRSVCHFVGRADHRAAGALWSPGGVCAGGDRCGANVSESQGAIAKGFIVVGVAGLLLAALANWELLPVNRGAGAVGGLFGGAGALFAGIWLNKR
jgi:hypothetical protein